MEEYKLIQDSSSVIRMSDMACIPDDPDNSDWIAYQAWLAEGFKPLPFDDVSMALNKQKAKELLAESDWTQIPDSGLANVEEFATYRTKLRQIAINPPSGVAPWPEKPNNIWK